MNMFRNTDAREWGVALRERSAHSKPGTTITVDVTPARATELLRFNNNNRSVSETHVTKLKRDMLSGRWAFNGETIIISDTGEINDGQHRLQAVIESGMTVQMLFTLGIKREFRTTTNMARVKRVADLLAMEGITAGNTVQTIANFLYAFENDGISHTFKTQQASLVNPQRTPSKAALMSFIRDNTTDIKLAMSLITKHSERICAQTRLASMFLVIARFTDDWSAAEEFFSGIVSGAGLEKTDPRFVTREKLIDLKASRVGMAAVAEVIIRGWNAYRDKKPLNRISVSLRLPDIHK